MHLCKYLGMNDKNSAEYFFINAIIRSYIETHSYCTVSTILIQMIRFVYQICDYLNHIDLNCAEVSKKDDAAGTNSYYIRVMSMCIGNQSTKHNSYGCR